MKLRLWLVGLLLGRQSAVVSIDPANKHLILVDRGLFGPDETEAIGKACGACTIIPLRMDYAPEGVKIKDTIQFFSIAAIKK